YLITWDGIWQGGTFYLHGAAMRVISDPLVATKFVAVGVNLITLLGMFLFSKGIYRDSRLASLVVLFAAPWWPHIWLGTGTMPEMPTTGFLLIGSGLFLSGIYAGRRLQLLAWGGSALSYACATTFHMVAWMMLGPILIVLLGYSWLSEKRGGPFGVTT